MLSNVLNSYVNLFICHWTITINYKVKAVSEPTFDVLVLSSHRKEFPHVAPPFTFKNELICLLFPRIFLFLVYSFRVHGCRYTLFITFAMMKLCVLRRKQIFRLPTFFSFSPWNFISTNNSLRCMMSWSMYVVLSPRYVFGIMRRTWEKRKCVWSIRWMKRWMENKHNLQEGYEQEISYTEP